MLFLTRGGCQRLTASLRRSAISPPPPYDRICPPQRDCLAAGVVDRRVEPRLAHEVAAAFLDSPPRHDPLTAAAYARLIKESSSLFERITSPGRPDGVRVFFTTCPQPYDDAGELIASVANERALEMTTVAIDPDRRHPLMDSAQGQAYDRFRAVHDILGHAQLGLGFDRDGEFAAWLIQERFHSPLARRALATELHAHHSVLWTTGQMAASKPVLLDVELIDRSRVGRSLPEPTCSLADGSWL